MPGLPTLQSRPRIQLQLTAILDQTFASQPMSHWREVFEQAHLTFGVVLAPSEVIKDPQLRANDIVVPLDGAGGNLKFTISSPLQVHDVAKVPARRAPELGEHSEEILKQLGFRHQRHRQSARQRRRSESTSTRRIRRPQPEVPSSSTRSEADG